MSDDPKTEKTWMIPPFVIEVDEDITGKYGFKDAHGEVDLVLPKPFSMVKKNVTLKLTLEKAKKLYEALGKMITWGDLPDYQRQRDGAE